MLLSISWCSELFSQCFSGFGPAWCTYKYDKYTTSNSIYWLILYQTFVLPERRLEVWSCCWMNSPAWFQNQLSLWATHAFPSVYSMMEHVSIPSSSSDHLGWSFGPSLGNKILPSSLLPVMPTFGPGLDLGVSVSMRPPTAADKLSNLTLELCSGGVDGILSVLSTLLPSRNRLLLVLTLPEGRVVDPCSLFVIAVSAAMIMPGCSRAQYSLVPRPSSKEERRVWRI